MADVEITVVGAGVVGLAVAARLAPRHPNLVILERERRHGTGTSSRNSEVIHAGLYYPAGSLKARLCVEGNRILYELCAKHGIAHRRVGKIVTATRPEEVARLESIFALGVANGAPLRRLTAADALALEPRIVSVEAVLSPSTGIVSAHELMDLLLGQARSAGAVLQPRAELIGLERRSTDFLVTVRQPAAVESYSSERVVNAAGLEADAVAGLAGIDVDAAGYRLHYCKGSYFSLSGHAGLVSRLVYPVPDEVSLGVHAVLDMGGGLKSGPDVEYLADRRVDYAVDESKRAAFAAAVRRILPEVQDEDLTPDISGVRPKLQGPGDSFRDFVIADEAPRGLSGLVNLIGIDSPGLTASVAIAREVERILAG
jgi:L-2-hydroxyglutarate oxidase LhgO